MEQTADIGLGKMEIRDEEHAGDGGDCVIYHGICDIGQDEPDKEEEGQDDGDARYGQPAVALGATVLVSLPFDFENVEVGKSDNGAEHIKDEQGDSGSVIDARKAEDHRGEHAEADHIAKRIELNAEVFFVIGSVLFGSCDNSVEHIANAGYHKAADCRRKIAVASELYSDKA